MEKWERSTKKLLLENLQPEIAAAIQEHIQSYNLGPILADYHVCIETVSKKKKREIFDLLVGGGKFRTDAVILTPKWLVIGTRGEKPDSAAALSVQLKDATIVEQKDHPAYQLLQENGVHVTGIFTGRVGTQGSQQISYYLGLGEEPAAKEFMEILRQAVRSTRL